MKFRFLLICYLAALSVRAIAQDGACPPDATAVCNDGSISYSAHHQGTCSHHGGVRTWCDGSSTPPRRRNRSTATAPAVFNGSDGGASSPPVVLSQSAESAAVAPDSASLAPAPATRATVPNTGGPNPWLVAMAGLSITAGALGLRRRCR